MKHQKPNSLPYNRPAKPLATPQGEMPIAVEYEYRESPEGPLLSDTVYLKRLPSKFEFFSIARTTRIEWVKVLLTDSENPESDWQEWYGGTALLNHAIDHPVFFRAELMKNKLASPHGICVDDLPEDIAGQCDLIQIEATTGYVTAAVKPSKEITAVSSPLSHKGESNRYEVEKAINRAIELGGDWLNCFNGKLVEIYKSLGFRPVCSTPFVDEFAPEDWPYEKYGRPDIVFLSHSLELGEPFSLPSYEDCENLLTEELNKRERRQRLKR